MSQFGSSGKNPPWVRNAAATASLGQQTQLTSPLLVQATIGGPGVSAAQGPGGPVSLQQQQSQQPTVTQQAAAYNAASLTAIGLAQVGLEQSRENVFLVQNPAALQPGAVLSQAGVALPASLTTAPVGTPGLALPTTLAAAPVATVSYPAPRVLQHTAPFPQQTQQPQQHTPKQRVFTGTVSKLHENFGFVDDDVFFQTNCIKGVIPKVGDRVLVEASYNPNMPFKWNAARIQMLPNQSQVQIQAQPAPPQTQALVRPSMMPGNPTPVMAPTGVSPQITLAIAPQPGPTIALPAQISQQAPSYSQVPPPAIHSIPPCQTSVNRLPSLMGTRRHSPPPPPLRRERERDIRRDERRERERHREREHERERERMPPVRKRSRSPRPRSRSPPRRRVRVAPRYVVQIPKISLDLKEANVLELRKRYSNMYVPSDFFFSSFVWMDAFQLRRPFTLERPCSYHIMNKEVDPVVENDAVLEPPDADHTYTCKVMLLAAPPLEDIFHKSCALAEDSPEAKENFVHPTRLISFLVGLKSKNETMAIGGPWSPSLDGPNPDKDPTVLIKTAIRTCKALTGIDLSPCTKWYRFAEIYYHRGETTHKSRVVPAHVETVVIFLPDVWNCTSTRKEWHNLAANYKKQLQKKLHEEMPEAYENQATEDMSKDQTKKDPSHHSELDPKVMKITDLRRELEVRNLSCKGLKSQLIARLTKALKAEHDKEEEEAEAHPEDEEMEDEDKIDADDKDEDRKKREEEDKKKEEKEKAVRERRYTLPDTPSIIVHPSRTAKGGKFDCTVMSLSVLLDYRQEDNKEYSFEVSLFAELFNEMLMRDFGFWIYRALVDIPEKKESEEKEKDKRKDKEKKEDKKEEKDDIEARKETCKKEEKKKRDDEENNIDDANEDEEEEEEDVEEDEEDEKKDKKKDEKKTDKDRKQEKLKMYTAHPGLLLAFVYFDQNHCGYLLDKDVEEILHTLGLNLSRAQVRKLLQNVITKDKLHYRKLTDKPRVKDETERNKAVEDKGEKDNSKDVSGGTASNVDDVSLGNKSLLSVVKCSTSPDDLNVSKGPPDVSDVGLVMYNGALLDIAKLLQQLQRSEKARTDTEQKLSDLQDELHCAKDVAAVVEQSNNKLNSDLRDYKRRLRVTDEELKLEQEASQKYKEAIKSCYDIIRPVIQVNESTDSVLKSEKNGPGNGEIAEKAEVSVKKEVCENGDT